MACLCALRKAAIEFAAIRTLILDRFRHPKVSADDRYRCYGRALAESGIDRSRHQRAVPWVSRRTIPNRLRSKSAAAAGLAFVSRSRRSRPVESWWTCSNPGKLLPRLREGMCALIADRAIGHDDKVDTRMISLLDDRNHQEIDAWIANQSPGRGVGGRANLMGREFGEQDRELSDRGAQSGVRMRWMPWSTS